jgi:hypothetical protein
MTTKQRATFDPAILAASVRDVAIEARRILKDSAREPYELGALTRRIHVLQRQAQGCSTGELSRWLENLSREVKTEPSRFEGPRRNGLDRSDDVGVN